MKTRSAKELFLLGFVTLFLELALIRYLGGNIWNLGYFPNLVLIGAFIGMGVGFVFHQRFDAERSMQMLRKTPYLLLVLVVLATFLRPYLPGFGEAAGEFDGELFFTAGARANRFGGLAMFAVWFLSVIAIFGLIAQATAKRFAQFEPLHAYTLDIAGSCAGIISFMLISWLRIPALFWFVASAPVFFFVLKDMTQKQKRAMAAVFALMTLLIFHHDTRVFRSTKSGTTAIKWSPYQKVKFAHHKTGTKTIFVNGIEHQVIYPVSEMKGMFYNVFYPGKREECCCKPSA